RDFSRSPRRPGTPPGGVGVDCRCEEAGTPSRGHAPRSARGNPDEDGAAPPAARAAAPGPGSFGPGACPVLRPEQGPVPALRLAVDRLRPLRGLLLPRARQPGDAGP